VLLAKRINQDAWQFPQGGVAPNENLTDAMYRELHEEVGLENSDVTVLGVTRSWLRYKLPKRLIRDSKPRCIGQKQKWFLLRLDSTDKNINLCTTDKPEFDGWSWVSYWYPLRQVISFKREVYRKALRELSPFLLTSLIPNWKKRQLSSLLSD